MDVSFSTPCEEMTSNKTTNHKVMHIILAKDDLITCTIHVMTTDSSVENSLYAQFGQLSHFRMFSLFPKDLTYIFI